MSLRRRLIAGALLVVLVLVVGNVMASRAFQRHLIDQVDRELTAFADRPALAGGRSPRPAQALTEYFIAVGDDLSSLVVVESDLAPDLSPPVLDPAQVRPNLGARGLRPGVFSAPSTDGSLQWRLVAFRTNNGLAVVGAPLSEVQATLARIRRVQVGAALAVLGALAMVGWWTVRLGIRPLEEMADSADAIAAGQLDKRVPHPPAETEAGRLGMALNSMLGRIESAFRTRAASEARLRRFAADASHELRTPLTSVRGYAELWRAGGLRKDGELDDAMRRIEGEATRMGALVEDLLLLARLDEGRPRQSEAVRLDLLAEEAVRDMQVTEPDRPVTTRLAEATIDGDENQLRQVLGNLLTNARRHTSPGTAVTVEVARQDGRIVLVVEDEGTGLSDAERALVFDRFWRADPARARAEGGSGLGLSIVKALVEAHGGSVRAGSSARGGARFVVDLPASQSNQTTAPNAPPADSQDGGAL